MVKKKKKKKIRLGHPPHLCHMERTGRLHGHIHPKDDSTKLWTQVWGEEWGGGGSFMPISGAATKEQLRISWWSKLSSVLPVSNCSQSFLEAAVGFSVYLFINFFRPNSVTWYDKHNPEQAKRGCWGCSARKLSCFWRSTGGDLRTLEVGVEGDHALLCTVNVITTMNLH